MHGDVSSSRCRGDGGEAGSEDDIAFARPLQELASPLETLGWRTSSRSSARAHPRPHLVSRVLSGVPRGLAATRRAPGTRRPRAARRTECACGGGDPDAMALRRHRAQTESGDACSCSHQAGSSLFGLLLRRPWKTTMTPEGLAASVRSETSRARIGCQASASVVCVAAAAHALPWMCLPRHPSLSTTSLQARDGRARPGHNARRRNGALQGVTLTGQRKP